MGKTTRTTAESDGEAQDPARTLDLASIAAQIAEEFPLVLEQTSLVLLDVDPERLHAFWTLTPADLARAGAAFPSDGEMPEPVIRLRRLHADGAAEVLSTRPLDAGTRGDARFTLANDGARYQAEIGLHSGHGGWMLLARSNQARLPRPVGVPIPPWTGEEPGPEAERPDRSPTGEGVPATPVAVPQRRRADDDHASGTQLVPGPSPAAARGQPPTPGTRPARWVLESAAAGGLAEAPSPADASPTAGSNASASLVLDGALPPLDRPWQPAIRIDWPWTDPAGPAPEGADTESGGTPALSVAAPAPAHHAEPAEGPRDGRIPAQRPGPISSFALGRGPDTPVVEAEVLVHVTASPGTLVELHGRPLRVGPSGRSTLRIPVTDLAILEQLLASPADIEEWTRGG